MRKKYNDNPDKLKLTNQQELGLVYFDDLHERIPRNQIKDFEKNLKKIIKKVSKDLQITITGSYRRKKETSGDIDVLLSHKKFDTKDKDTTKPVTQTVASVRRSVKPGRKNVKLTSSQVQIARKLGVPLEEYAKQLLNTEGA